MAAIMGQEELITDTLIHMAVQHMELTASITAVVLQDIHVQPVTEVATAVVAGRREAQEAVHVTAEAQASDQEVADLVNN